MRVFSSLLLLLFAGIGAQESQAAASSTRNSGPKAAQFIVAQATKPKQSLTESQSFKITQFINSCDAYNNFIKTYPSGQFVQLALKWKSKNCRPKSVRRKPALPPALPRDGELATKEIAEPQSSPRASPRKVRPSVKQPRQLLRKTRRKTSKRKRANTARSKTAKKKTTTSRIKRRSNKRCRLETVVECIRRAGQIQRGQCDRQRRCD
ncbi:MAG: hypothetical protein ACI89J_000287 [Hyphomicrobiaceae bacterium]|jgi:hypothetical protein